MSLSRSLRTLVAALVAGVVFAWCLPAEAQFGGNSGQGTTSNGAFGNRTVGGGSGSLGGGSTTGARTGMAGAGNAGSSIGMVDSTAVPTGFQSGTVLATAQRTGFVGANSASTANMQSLQGAQQAARVTNVVTQQLRTLLSQQNNQNDFNSQQQRGRQGRGQTPQIRIPLRLGFQPQRVATTQFTSRLEERFRKLPALPSGASIRVEMEGGTAILRGTVASEQERELAAGLAQLEPEVEAVQNELVVDQAAPQGEALPPVTGAR